MAESKGRPRPADWIPEAVATGRVQRLRPSMAAAGEMISQARTHLRSAATIAGTDSTLAVSACHDASRQAITDHIRASGYRVANQAGAHRSVVEYAETVLGQLITTDDVEALDALRRDRHTAEYGDFASRIITQDRARQALSLATRVVDAVANALAQQR